MAKKYHWSYEQAMSLVDSWLAEFGMSLPDIGDAYESLVQAVADEIERQRESGKSEGRSESRSDMSERRPYPRPWQTPNYWMGVVAKRKGLA